MWADLPPYFGLFFDLTSPLALAILGVVETDQIETQEVVVPAIHFFAYGTLRKGEALHGWIDEEIIESFGTAKLKRHKLFYASSHFNFPYLVETGEGEDMAVGEVYVLPVNDQVLSMLRMEQGAGYRIVSADAELDNGETLEVIVCRWDNGSYGDAIPNNDWCSAERREWWR